MEIGSACTNFSEADSNNRIQRYKIAERLLRNIKIKTWNIGCYMLEWTYNMSKVTAYVTKKPHRATDGAFLLPS